MYVEVLPEHELRQGDIFIDLPWLLFDPRETFIIDGELEQGFYPRARVKFESMVGSTLSVAYDGAGVRIYQVK